MLYSPARTMALVVIVAGAASCDEAARPRGATSAAAAARATPAASGATSGATPTTSDTASGAPAPLTPTPAGTASSAPAPRTAAASASAPAPTPVSGAAPVLVIDEPNDAGPAAPMAATARGVLFVSKAGELTIGALDLPLPAGGKPRATKLGAAKLAPTEVMALGRGPAVTTRYAYWVAGGELRRRALGVPGAATTPAAAGPMETLAPAVDGSRAAAREVAGRDVVAFVAREGDESVARIWREGRGVTPLSPVGAGATAVSLLETTEGVFAVALDARMAMTQLHVRPVGRDGEPGEDAVVWSGGPAQALTEVAAVGSGGHRWAFVAMERDATHFALAELTLPGTGGPGEAGETWRAYANGLDPAPVAAATLCGAPFIATVRPESAAPGASQVVEVASVPGGTPARVAAARAVNDLSLATVPGGGLVAWVADKRTWAATLRCARQG